MIDDEHEDSEEERPKFTGSMYTDEVNDMLANVLQVETHLFTRAELDRFDSFKSLSGESKHLFVRLWMRKHHFVRLDKLDYATHIQDIKTSADELCSNGMARSTISHVEALQLLLRDEIVALAKKMRIVVEGRTKTHFINAILQAGVTEKIKIEESVLNLTGPCIILDKEIHSLFQRLHLVYYRITDPEETVKVMSSAILARMSRRNFPQYDVYRTGHVWKTRQDLLAYEEALDIRRQFDERFELIMTKKQGNEREPLIACWTLCENIVGLWDEGLETHQEERPYYMRRFEAGKLHEYELETAILRKLLNQKVYRLGKRGRWYERLALVQMAHMASNEKNNQRQWKKTALETCIEAIQDPTVHQSERISNITAGRKSVWRGNDGAACSVEELALEYYNKQGYRGLHAEGGVVSMLFMLLFWDILFASVPGVFETPYQTAPLDFGSDAFYIGRSELINTRLDDILRGQCSEIIERVDERERPRQTVCAGVNWTYEKTDLLSVAEDLRLYLHYVNYLPKSLVIVIAVFLISGKRFTVKSRVLISKQTVAGTKVKNGAYLLKGPGDKLSETQKLWIDTLTGFDIPVEVCYVKLWQDEESDVLMEQNRNKQK
ncbi:hypothetical protein DFQ28_000364 [Apophysomyces sp. BC1034]|nr:hypothetical protein DFQ28_000364 [Apophysomyces sp. BC1034]